MPSTHILKPDSADSEYPGLATNEYFCMRLAGRCGLPVASVELISAAGRPCLVVERFDRDLSTSPVKRLHQEDLCQALGLTPDFKYQKEGWRLPSYAALGDLLEEHGERPGNDRLAAARAAVFHYLVGNADAHAKNISLLHGPSGVRLAPLYDVVSTAAYPELSPELALSIGDELDPEAIGAAQWVDLAADLRLQPRAFERERARLVEVVRLEAVQLHNEARAEGWDDEVIATTLEVIEARAERTS
jgi:serine/threonine-protein kinase HipA